MKNFIFYKKNQPINLNYVLSIKKAKEITNIIFTTITGNFLYWNFSSNSERNAVYKEILKLYLEEVKIKEFNEVNTIEDLLH